MIPANYAKKSMFIVILSIVPISIACEFVYIRNIPVVDEDY